MSLLTLRRRKLPGTASVCILKRRRGKVNKRQIDDSSYFEHGEHGYGTRMDLAIFDIAEISGEKSQRENR